MKVKFSDIPGFMEKLKIKNPERYERILKNQEKEKNSMSITKDLSSFPEVMTIEEVCKVTGLKDTTIKDLLTNNLIGGRKIGRVYRFPKTSVKEFCKKIFS